MNAALRGLRLPSHAAANQSGLTRRYLPSYLSHSLACLAFATSISSWTQRWSVEMLNDASATSLVRSDLSFYLSLSMRKAFVRASMPIWDSGPRGCIPSVWTSADHKVFFLPNLRRRASEAHASGASCTSKLPRKIACSVPRFRKKSIAQRLFSFVC